MKRGYYIYNPFLNKKDLISLKELTKITKLNFNELYHIVKNCIYLKNLGFILPSSTPEYKFKLLESLKFWTRLTLPCPCDYEISHHGDVRRILSDGTRSKPLKPQFNKTENRYYVNLSIDKKRVHLYIDAAVIHHFLKGDYNPYDDIEYIDGNPSNLHCNNLRSIPNKIGDDEQWSPINREGSTYEISNYGRVRKILNFRYIYLKNRPKGNSKSMCVFLSLAKTRAFFTVSRLVAENFLEGFSEDVLVTFRDGDNTNLYYKNLIFLSKEEIGKRASKRSESLRKVICTDITSSSTLGPFYCAKEAARQLNLGYQCVLDNLSNKSKVVAKKYIFKYLT